MLTFEYSINDQDTDFYRVKFTGKIRAGEQLSSESFSIFLKKVKKEAISKIIIIDLDQVSYWDSEGMRKIISLVEDINRINTLRASIIGNKNSKNFERAKEKYYVESNTIPWVETEAEFIKMIES